MRVQEKCVCFLRDFFWLKKLANVLPFQLGKNFEGKDIQFIIHLNVANCTSAYFSEHVTTNFNGIAFWNLGAFKVRDLGAWVLSKLTMNIYGRNGEAVSLQKLTPTLNISDHWPYQL